MLKAMGIEEEKIEQIIEAHTETVSALKDERDSYKEDAEKLADVQKELNTAKEKIAKHGDGETVSKTEFDELKKEYEDYKKDITAKETRTAKVNAFRELLKAAGVSDKRFDTVIKVSDIDEIERDKDGRIKDADKITEEIKTEWADFIPTTTVVGANTANPPATTGGSFKTRAEIMKIKDTTERQAALAEFIAKKGNM
jgi:chromosome segregation ATPase